MMPSQELRKKLVLIIGDLICRCIDEARHIPYILRRDEIVDLLVHNPARFQKLVEDERFDRTEYSTGTLTAKLDALAELGQFEMLDAYDMSLCGRNETENDLSPAIEHINQLTRTFAVYISNAVTVFEREFELFTEKLRLSLCKSGMALRVVEFIEADMAELDNRAGSLLASGQLLQAFLFERLVSCRVITKQVVVLPSDYSLGEKLIGTAIKEAGLFTRLVKFILRVNYISQGSWEDLFAVLVRVVAAEPEDDHRSTLIDLIEQDAIFCCNLLCGTYTDLKHQNALDRRSAIDRILNRCSQKASVA